MERIRTELRALQRGSVLVGWPGNSPRHREVIHTTGTNGKRRARKSKVESPMTVAALAVAHEYGIPARNLPSRPVMRQAAQMYSKSLEAFNRRLLLAIYSGAILPSRALAQLGVFWEGKLKQTFRTGTFTPLKRATILAKGSSKPLIDSGQLRGSVTSRVVSG